MYKKDKIKILTLLIMITIIGLTYWFFGKDSIILKSLAAVFLAVWFVLMFILNKKK